MIRVITVNLNGIRRAAQLGFFDWMLEQNADFICLQETKAQTHQLELPVFHPPGYHCFFFDAEKKGYSGVAIYSRWKPQCVHFGLGQHYFDCEGRYLQVDLENLSIVSLYLPSGTSGEERQAFKYKCLDMFMAHLRNLHSQSRDYIICGDWNIAHKKIDLKNWRGNQKNSGFLPEERAWMDDLFEKEHFVDAFRVLNQMPEYTWWSNRGQAWAKNVGWRIDYQVITPGLKEAVKKVAIYKEKRFSDHAPLIIDYDYSL